MNGMTVLFSAYSNIKERTVTFTFAFADLEKSFDRVPRKVPSWALRKEGIPEWIVCVVQIMSQNVRSRVRINNSYSDAFKVQEGVHQGSVLTPFLFIIVLEALSREFQTGCPWELLLAGDLVITADIMDELLYKLDLWKNIWKPKALELTRERPKL